jgi:hypothetical protein
MLALGAGCWANWQTAFSRNQVFVMLSLMRVFSRESFVTSLTAGAVVLLVHGLPSASTFVRSQLVGGTDGCKCSAVRDSSCPQDQSKPLLCSGPLKECNFNSFSTLVCDERGPEVCFVNNQNCRRRSDEFCP